MISGTVPAKSSVSSRARRVSTFSACACMSRHLYQRALPPRLDRVRMAHRPPKQPRWMCRPVRRDGLPRGSRPPPARHPHRARRPLLARHPPPARHPRPATQHLPSLARPRHPLLFRHLLLFRHPLLSRHPLPPRRWTPRVGWLKSWPPRTTWPAFSRARLSFIAPPRSRRAKLSAVSWPRTPRCCGARQGRVRSPLVRPSGDS